MLLAGIVTFRLAEVLGNDQMFMKEAFLCLVLKGLLGFSRYGKLVIQDKLGIVCLFED